MLQLEALLDGLPQRTPAWVLPGRHDRAAQPDQATRALEAMEAVDRQLCSLVYGLGIGLGAASAVLRLDPALAAWRLRTCLLAGSNGVDAAALEAGLARLLGPAAATAEKREWSARQEVLGWPEPERRRLVSRLGEGIQASDAEQRRSGLGVGVLFVVGLAVVVVMLYGAVRDADPIWRAYDLIRLARYEEARTALEQALALRRGDAVEAHMLMAISWLAEGRYREAHAELANPKVAAKLGTFRPFRRPVLPVEADPASGALLPRGQIITSQPDFVYRAGPAGDLVLDRGFGREERVPLPDTTGGPEIVSVPWPDAWPSLGGGTMTWSVPGSEAHLTTFTVIEEALSIRTHASRFLRPDRIPRDARRYLRANLFLRFFLYQQAAENYASLARQYPEQPYPRKMVERVAEALGVDPGAFLR